MQFDCPELGALVELSDEREMHIISRHPELTPIQTALIAGRLRSLIP